MAAPTIDDVLTAAQSHAQGLALPMNVIKRKQAKFEDGVDARPVLVVHRARGKPEKPVPWASSGSETGAGGLYLWTFVIGFTVYASNLNDQETTLPALSGWRDVITEAFKSKTAVLSGPLGKVPGLRDVRANPRDFLPDEKILIEVDLLLVEVEVEIVKGL